MGDFRKALRGDKVLFFDGGMGTMLQARGLPAGVSPEVFCLERPDVLEGIHLDYARAGSDVLTTNSFGGSRFKLPAEINPYEFNKKMAQAARKAADRLEAEQPGRRVFVAGSVGPSGKFLRPLGEIAFEELVDGFREQIRGLKDGGANLVIIETQFDIAETRAAVFAARRECALPIAVSCTFEAGLTLTGSSPEVCAATFGNMGVDIIGTNCSAGPEEIKDAALRLVGASRAPVLIEPNAGLPELVDGKTVFRLAPQPFAELTAAFARAGASLLGGCCGTTPDHIAALKKVVDKECATRIQVPAAYEEGTITLTTRGSLVKIGGSNPLRIIGERINPTGKKQLTQEFQNGEFTQALQFSDEQKACGAAILDVNTGAPMVDEAKLLPELASRLAERHEIPLSLDSPNPTAIEEALKRYPASPLVNSISGEPGRMEKLGPLCRDFGAPFILLPLRGKELPVSAAERITIVEALLEQMDALNIPRHLAMVDCLVLAASSTPDAAEECLKFIRHCVEKLHLPVVAGLSNISFGLPARELVNAGFLTLASGAGLSACIANPGSARIQEAVAVVNLLRGKDNNAEYFISNFSGWSNASGNSNGNAPGNTPANAMGGAGQGGNAPAAAVSLEDAVILGRKEEALKLLEEALAKGEDPFTLVNGRLIPAITEVGGKYERKEYFLPQLLRSAETMQEAFKRLKPLLDKEPQAAKRATILMATVEGDIHDIGKNIVSLMLGNHGFDVIDIGKDVTAEQIVRLAKEHRADLIGLSALMTTTMVRMEETVNLVKKEGLPAKVIVGGAVVSQKFADSIGADAYAIDAVDAVRVAKALL